MSEPLPSTPERPRSVYTYVTAMLLYVFCFSIAQIAIFLGLYALIYGLPTPNSLMVIQVPGYSHTALWKGRVWYPLMRVGPGQSVGSAVLMSADPEKGDLKETAMKVDFPLLGMCPDGEQLWAITTSRVFRVQGDSIKDFKPKRVLTRPSEPFVYEGQLAVIDSTKTGIPTLLVFQSDEWVEVGGVVIPLSLATQQVDGKATLVSAAPTPGAGALLEVKVISYEGTLHTFVSDGVTIVYRNQLELAPVSALSPANAPQMIDFSNPRDWEVACTTASRVGIASKDAIKAGLVNGEPILVTGTGSSRSNPFQNVILIAYQRVNGQWMQTTQMSSPSLLDLLLNSDGQKTYVAGQSFVQVLRFYQLTPAAFEATGVLLKVPQMAIQAIIENMALFGQFVYWPALLFYALGVSYLMRIFVDPAYSFGKTQVELASFTRRGIAQVIDYFVYAISLYPIQVAYGLASKEQIEENIDQIFDFGPNGMMRRYLWMAVTLMVVGLSIMAVKCAIEGRWGITLGKWICGIRTVRTTLRPCGFFRAVFREILLYVDCAAAMSLIPITLLFAFLKKRQRLGDIVADTIVIRKPRPDAAAPSEPVTDVSSMVI